LRLLGGATVTIIKTLLARVSVVHSVISRAECILDISRLLSVSILLSEAVRVLVKITNPIVGDIIGRIKVAARLLEALLYALLSTLG
jgi:hypothetical protein